MINNYKSIKDINANKLSIIIWSLLTGLFAGTVVVLYRLVLTHAETISNNTWNNTWLSRCSL